MTVVHVSLAHGFRGGEQQAQYLMWALAATGQAQILVAQAGQPLLERMQHLPGLKIWAVSGRLGAVVVLASMDEQAEDMIGHAHDSHAHTALWLSGYLGSRMPYVVSRRVMRAPAPARWRGGKYAPGRLRALLCVSEAVATLHRERMRDAGPAIVRVYDAAMRPDVEVAVDVRAQLGLSPAVRLVGTVAALAPEKDVATFVKTCARLVDRYPDLHFVHVGGGSAEALAEFEALRRKAGLDGRLHGLGFRSDAQAILANFDVFLFTSRWEGLGSSILEAQLRGVPVVSTAVGGTTEVLRESVSGLLAPVGDVEVLAQAVGRLLDEESLRMVIIVGGRAQVAQFSVEAMAAASLTAYHQALTSQ